MRNALLGDSPAGWTRGQRTRPATLPKLVELPTLRTSIAVLTSACAQVRTLQADRRICRAPSAISTNKICTKADPETFPCETVLAKSNAVQRGATQ
jgi:hypothetical protein